MIAVKLDRGLIDSQLAATDCQHTVSKIFALLFAINNKYKSRWQAPRRCHCRAFFDLLMIGKQTRELISDLERSICTVTTVVQAGGTGPVGPAMAGPTFEPGRIYIFYFKKHCELF